VAATSAWGMPPMSNITKWVSSCRRSRIAPMRSTTSAGLPTTAMARTIAS